MASPGMMQVCCRQQFISFTVVDVYCVVFDCATLSDLSRVDFPEICLRHGVLTKKME